MKRRHALVVLGSLSLGACSASADIAASEAGVTQFHTLLDSGQFERIYSESADEMKQASTAQALTELLAAIHRKLGAVKSAERQGWNTNYTTSGSFVTLTYKTIFAAGEATEQFVFRMKDKTAALAGYHINSTTLVLT